MGGSGWRNEEEEGGRRKELGGGNSSAAQGVADGAELGGGALVGVCELGKLVFDLGDFGAEGVELCAKRVDFRGVSGGRLSVSGEW